jgi:hypothetical protein
LIEAGKHQCAVDGIVPWFVGIIPVDRDVLVQSVYLDRDSEGVRTAWPADIGAPSDVGMTLN